MMIVVRMVLLAALSSGLTFPLLAQTDPARSWRLAVVAPSEASLKATQQVTLPALARLGFAKGRNLEIVSDIALPDHLAATAQKIVQGKPDVILTVGGEILQAVHAVTRTIPIVSFGPDPAGLGEVPKPKQAGNVTGIAIPAAELDGKRLSLLDEALPKAKRFAALLRTNSPASAVSEAGLREMAKQASLQLTLVEAGQQLPYRTAFDRFRAAKAEALVVAADATLQRDTAGIIELATAARLPTICQWPQMVEAGCLMAYGPPLDPLRVRLASFIARIFRGVPPAEIPIEPPASLELVLNFKVAKALGIRFPDALVLRADEIIE